MSECCTWNSPVGLDGRAGGRRKPGSPCGSLGSTRVPGAPPWWRPSLLHRLSLRELLEYHLPHLLPPGRDEVSGSALGGQLTSSCSQFGDPRLISFTKQHGHIQAASVLSGRGVQKAWASPPSPPTPNRASKHFLPSGLLRNCLFWFTWGN